MAQRWSPTSDAGRYDGDKRFDRAIGPLQFIPTTWGVVGVDADGDGERNPQDVDDAALAAAVYLCSGTEDLAHPQELRRAVWRYNHSESYVDLVVSVMRSYADGEAVTSRSGMIVPTGVSARPTGSSHGGKAAPSGKSGPRISSGTPVAPQPPPPSGPDRDPGGESPPVAQPPAPRAPLAPVVRILSGTAAVLQCTSTGLSQLLQSTTAEGCGDRTGD